MIKTIIVDDEPTITEEMVDLFRKHKSYEVCGAYSEPLSALEEAKRIKPDCAFLDIEMMGVNGIELAERLLALNPDMEIVFVTAYNHYAAQAFEINAVDYLLKPVRSERLKKALDRMDHNRKDKPKLSRSACTIKCFGGFEVFAGDQRIKWNRSKTRELFAYLLQYQGKSLSKYTLCELLWPEHPQEQALAYLQTSIWSIRKKFKETGHEGIHIEYSDNRYFVKLDGVSRDVAEFEKHYREFKRTGDQKERLAALEYYQGEYMDGEDWLWAYEDRARYGRMYEELMNIGR